MCPEYRVTYLSGRTNYIFNNRSLGRVETVPRQVGRSENRTVEVRLHASDVASGIDCVVVDAFTLSPDGSHVAYATSATGNAHNWVKNVDGSEVRQLANDPAADA
jgi:hypothetical protein